MFCTILVCSPDCTYMFCTVQMLVLHCILGLQFCSVSRAGGDKAVSGPHHTQHAADEVLARWGVPVIGDVVPIF